MLSLPQVIYHPFTNPTLMGADVHIQMFVDSHGDVAASLSALNTSATSHPETAWCPAARPTFTSRTAAFDPAAFDTSPFDSSTSATAADGLAAAAATGSPRYDMTANGSVPLVTDSPAGAFDSLRYRQTISHESSTREEQQPQQQRAGRAEYEEGDDAPLAGDLYIVQLGVLFLAAHDVGAPGEAVYPSNPEVGPMATTQTESFIHKQRVQHCIIHPGMRAWGLLLFCCRGWADLNDVSMFAPAVWVAGVDSPPGCPMSYAARNSDTHSTSPVGRMASRKTKPYTQGAAVAASCLPVCVCACVCCVCRCLLP